MAYISTEEYCFKNFGLDSVVYKVGSAETLLLERRAANILQVIPSKSITFSQLEECVATGIDSDPENFSLVEVLNHLVAAGLIKEVA